MAPPECILHNASPGTELQRASGRAVCTSVMMDSESCSQRDSAVWLRQFARSRTLAMGG